MSACDSVWGSSCEALCDFSAYPYQHEGVCVCGYPHGRHRIKEGVRGAPTLLTEVRLEKGSETGVRANSRNVKEASSTQGRLRSFLLTLLPTFLSVEFTSA